MTPQMHADHLLRVWQQRRLLPPAMRLMDSPPLAPDEYEDVLGAVADAMTAEVRHAE